MAYVRQNFVDFDESNPLCAQHLKNIEEGIMQYYGQGEGSLVTEGWTYAAGSEDTEEDKRYNEAIGTGSIASGQGAVAYSRSSKSFGYRTQTGYPPSQEEVDKRTHLKNGVPVVEVEVDPTFPDDSKGQGAVAIGADTVATENHALAGGYKSKALNMHAFAFGSHCIASGHTSNASGANTIASGVCSHAEGNGSQAIGDSTHAEGSNTIASGGSAHAEGNNTRAMAAYAHAEGRGTEASSIGSHAEGQGSTASGNSSHAEGNNTVASGSFSHTEGQSTEAIGNRSHAEGYGAKASGSASHAEGLYTIASGDFSHTEGKYNIQDHQGIYQHIAGNGEYNRPSNSYTLDWQGNGAYAGSVSSTTGADYAEYFEWEDGNPNNEDRVGYVVTLNGEKIRKATSADDILGIISGTAAVIGDTAEWNWSKRFLTDEFGRYITEDVEQFIDDPKEVLNDETGETEIIIEKVSVGFAKVPVTNPEWDENKEYIRRKDRPEWGCVGMFGKLYVRDDSTCQVNGYAKVGVGGELTASDEKTNMRVLTRVNDTVVRVLLK